MTLRAKLVRLAAAACAPTIAVLSLLPKEDLARTGAPHGLEHFVADAGAAMLAGLAWPKSARAMTLAYVGYAGALEFLQNWSPGRDANVANFLESSGGAVAGALTAVVIQMVMRRRSAHNLA